MAITVRIDAELSVAQFVDLLERSGLAHRRPVDDAECIAGMLAGADLTVTAWDGDTLVGVARSVTDFHYACYLSDLAVDGRYQGKGVGRHLQRVTMQQLGPRCTLMLIAAPAADTYYDHIGLTRSERCWVLAPGTEI